MQDSLGSTGFRTLLRELRLGAGLTQARLAERAGLAERTIQDLERGRSRPTRQTATRLMTVLEPRADFVDQFEAATSIPRRVRRTAERVPREAVDTEPVGPSQAAHSAVRGRGAVQPRLPAPVTTFIGRERQLADVARLMESRRLVTLTGPGGCGKTRLGVEAASRAALLGPDGTYFVSLAPLSDFNLVSSMVANVLEIRQSGHESLVTTLRQAIGERQMLLLLDNFEHLLPAAPLVGELLAGCANLRVLVTSREMLRVDGEQLYAVPPLALAAMDTSQTDSDGCGASRCDAEAVRLFADRASSADATFRLDVSNTPVVAAVCARLDGLPLAIELAAARVGLLSPQEILSRLTTRLALLTSGARDVHPRQQTLRNTMTWSHDLLSDTEQRLFRRVSVFSGGFTLEAAQAVADADAVPAFDVVNGVASLVAKSLVQRRADANGDSRFAMLETIREYAAERLEASGEGEAIRQRHVDYCIGLVERADDEIRCETDGRWVHRLEEEHDNVRAALSWCDSSADTRHLLPLLTNPLWMFWWQRGHWVEACRWYDRVLELSTEPAARLGALRGRGQIAVQRGDLRRAAALWEEAIALARAAGEFFMLSLALGRRAYTAALAGDSAYAQILADEGLLVAHQTSDPERVALALNEVAHATRARGDTAGARLVLEEALRLSRAANLGFFVPYALQQLSLLAVEQGDLMRAVALAEEALGLFQQRDDRWGIQNTRSRIIQVAQVLGDRSRTAALARENLILAREIGSLPPVADHLVYLAWVARLDGRLLHATRLIAAAEAIWETTGRHIRPAQRRALDAEVSVLRDALGEDSFTAAQLEGRAFSVDRAIRHALEEEASA